MTRGRSGVPPPPKKRKKGKLPDGPRAPWATKKTDPKKRTIEGTIEILWERTRYTGTCGANLGLFCAFSARAIPLNMNMPLAFVHRETFHVLMSWSKLLAEEKTSFIYRTLLVSHFSRG